MRDDGCEFGPLPQPRSRATGIAGISSLTISGGWRLGAEANACCEKGIDACTG